MKIFCLYTIFLIEQHLSLAPVNKDRISNYISDRLDNHYSHQQLLHLTPLYDSRLLTAASGVAIQTLSELKAAISSCHYEGIGGVNSHSVK